MDFYHDFILTLIFYKYFFISTSFASHFISNIAKKSFLDFLILLLFEELMNINKIIFILNLLDILRMNKLNFVN